MARCPAHEDRVQSLSVGLGDDGKTLFYCHAGCSYREIVEALSEGEWERRLHPSPARELGSSSESVPKPATFDRFEAVYDYEDENGQLLFKVCRTHDKRFFQCHPDAQSPTGFYWGLGGARRVPYRLPRVREAVRAGQRVYIVEGEKDVHAIERAGRVATCNPMGASKGKSKWRSEWNEFFRGARVVIVADRDEVGRVHARDVYSNLVNVAGTVHMTVPVVGNDAYDHLAAGKTLGELAHVW